MEIYQMAALPPAWNMARMAGNKRDGKKAESEARAQALYQRLMKLDRPSDLSNNEWTKAAGVSTSFFTNLQSRPNKPGSEPSIGNLRSILEVVGTSIPEFFSHEAQGRLVSAPTRQAIEQALQDAWADAPKNQDRRISYLASVVLQLLGLPESSPAIASEKDAILQDVREATSPVRRSTNRA